MTMYEGILYRALERYAVRLERQIEEAADDDVRHELAAEALAARASMARIGWAEAQVARANGTKPAGR